METLKKIGKWKFPIAAAILVIASLTMYLNFRTVDVGSSELSNNLQQTQRSQALLGAIADLEDDIATLKSIVHGPSNGRIKGGGSTCSPACAAGEQCYCLDYDPCYCANPNPSN